MPPQVSPDELADDLAPVSRWLLLLDFDGCLSPLVDEPDDARPAAGALEAIRALAVRTDVAIVSGRPVADLRRRLPVDLPVLLAGGHGAELAEPAADPQPLVEVDQSVLDALADDVRAMVEESAGWRTERKPASVAVHHRQVRGVERDRIPEVRARFERDAGDDFVVLDGHEVTELRPTSTDKGKVVDLLVERFPDRLPLSFGDDTTDEDAFAAARRHGGRAVLVATEDRDSHATTRLRTPDEVVATLQRLATS